MKVFPVIVPVIGATGVLDQIKGIEARLPFALKGFDCDNGSEFLNYHLLRYFTDHPRQIAFTRTRPYKKNDDPKTPCQRVFESDQVSKETKQQLKLLHQSLNPFIYPSVFQRRNRGDGS